MSITSRALAASICVVLVVPSVAVAQAPAPVAAPPAAMAQANALTSANSLIVGAPQQSLRVGTELPLRLLTELTTKGKMLKLGDRFSSI